MAAWPPKPPSPQPPKPGGMVIGSTQPAGGSAIQQYGSSSPGMTAITPRPSSYTPRSTSLAPGYILGPDGRPKWVGEREAARLQGGSPGFGGAYAPGQTPSMASLLAGLNLGAGAGAAGASTSTATGGAGTGGAEGVPDWVNEVEMDPFLRAHAERIQARLNAPDTVTQRAIERAGGAIRDLGEGQAKGVRGRFQRLGAEAGEAGAEEEALGQIQEDITSGVARSAADISAQRERDIFNEMIGATGALGAPGAAAARDREQALRQWAELEANRRAREALDIQRQAQNIAVTRSIFDLLPDLGGAFGY
jgi:hypothetical protein